MSIDRRETLVAQAAWLGYGHAERADAWLQRLDVNRPELDVFRSLPTPHAQPYRALPSTLRAPEGVLHGGEARSDDSVSLALERARNAEHLHAFTWLAQGTPEASAGFLAGMAIAIKDLIAIEGVPLSGGTRAMDREPARQDAEAVARLKRAGASVIGTTNLHELAYGITSDNPRFGRVVNPVAPDRIPGGSSGGSAAAIAAGIVRGAIGTDTAGSIRIPAACCGVVGFKPSYDAVPRDGVLDLAPSLDHVGPLGRSVADCARLFAGMLDLGEVPPWALGDLRALRIARLTGYFDEPLDPEVRAAVTSAMEALAADGARTSDQAIASIETAPAIQLNTIAPEATAVHMDLLRDRGALLGEDVRVRLEMGLFLPAPWYVKAQRLRAELVQRVDAAFEDADVLVCATLRAPAPPVGATRVEIEGTSYPLHAAMTQLTLPFSLGGFPCLSVPWTVSREGIPIAVQIVAPRGDDWRALAVAQRLEHLRRNDALPADL